MGDLRYQRTRPPMNAAKLGRSIGASLKDERPGLGVDDSLRYDFSRNLEAPNTNRNYFAVLYAVFANALKIGRGE